MSNVALTTEAGTLSTVKCEASMQEQSNRIGDAGDGMKIENVTPRKSSLKTSNQSPRSGLKVVFSEISEAQNISSGDEGDKVTITKVLTSPLAKEKFSYLSHCWGLLKSGNIGAAWKHFTYTSKFTRLDKKPREQDKQHIENVAALRNQYELTGERGLDTERLQARVSRCLERGDFKEISSMITLFQQTGVGRFSILEKDIAALDAIREVLNVASSKSNDNEIRRMKVEKLLSLISTAE